uniref:TBC1 domain family member 7-like n=1 Tax=Styela clava TaxID=7725 RepID=UPI0019399D02|nr:TBC1 domain family member 7-like [Styela clava]
MADIATKRNFRAPYFGRGVRVVENKKALENLLKDDTIDKDKLAQYCSFHPLPAMYRVLIWKILLDVLPVHQQSHKFVMKQRCEQYEDLHHALKVMRKIDDKTSRPHIYLSAYILETGQFGLHLYHEKWHDLFLDISSSVCKMTDDNVDGYWLSVNIYKTFSGYFEKNDEHEMTFCQAFSSVLKKESPKLHEHLSKIQALACLPYKRWFIRCFSGTLQTDGGLERVWDVLISGYFTFLPFVAVQILLTMERRLLRLENIMGILDALNEIPYEEEVGEVIACKGVDLWQRHAAKNSGK